MRILILMSDSEQGGIILSVLGVLFVIGFIYIGISTSIDRKNIDCGVYIKRRKNL